MKWSWKLGEIAGIGIYVHATFLILLVWVALSHYLAGQSIAMMLNGIVFLLALFGIVVLHELGHALTAKRFGIPTRNITLLPIGAVARLERMPDDPKQELWVALAGPAVNVVLAAVLYIVLRLTSGVAPLNQFNVVGGQFLSKLMWVNVSLALFNMLPAFPMDGGRMLRALLAMRLDYVRATQIAANIGQGMAFLFGVIGLFYNPFLVLESVFARLNACRCHSLPLVRNGQLAGLITMDNVGEFLMVQTALAGKR